MLTINDLKAKMIVLIDGAPYQVLEIKHLHMGRGGSSAQTKIKNLLTGKVFSRNFKPADKFGEADIEKRELVYIYGRRGEYVFGDKDNPQERFSLRAGQVGEAGKWLKPETPVGAMFLGGRPVAVSPPVKIDLKVIEAPPGIQGDRSQAGTKTAAVETGARVQVPLFINEGDVIRINTESGEYVERVEKRQ